MVAHPRPGSGPTTPLAWFLWVDGARTGPENMAWDHTLALGPPPGLGVRRRDGWARPTLSLGRKEPARDVFDPDRLLAQGVDLVRRPTGGRSVLHDRELTYTVVAPLKALGGARAAYALVNRGLAEGLATLGVPAALAASGPTLPPDAGPCFQEPVEGEVVSQGRKLIGSAQARVGSALLQHGSILLEDGQHRLDGLRLDRADSPDPGRETGGIRGVLKRPVTVGEVARAVGQGLQLTLPGDWRPTRGGASLGETGLPSEPAPELLARDRSPEWSWRR